MNLHFYLNVNREDDYEFLWHFFSPLSALDNTKYLSITEEEHDYLDRQMGVVYGDLLKYNEGEVNEITVSYSEAMQWYHFVVMSLLSKYGYTSDFFDAKNLG